MRGSLTFASATDLWPPTTGHRPLATDHWPLTTGFTLLFAHCTIAAQLSPLRHSYPERQRDRPFEASATCPRDQVPEDVVPTPAERRFWKMRGQPLSWTLPLLIRWGSLHYQESSDDDQLHDLASTSVHIGVGHRGPSR